jgi:uncharacterized protein YoxC
MNFLQRILSPFLPPAPDCGHEAEIHKLRNELLAARLARQLVEKSEAAYRSQILLERDAHTAHVQDLNALHEAFTAERSAEIERQHAELTEARRMIQEHRTDIVGLLEENDGFRQRERELAGQLEEAQSTIAVLTTRVRELGGNVEQLPLTAGGETDPASEVPEGDDQEITNQVIELAFRLVGVFFDDGPGRRHNWIMERGAERAKVPIVDKGFIERVAKREISFGAGDTLVGDFHVITWLRTNGDVDVEYRTCDVVKRIIAPDVQTEIPMEVASAAAH